MNRSIILLLLTAVLWGCRQEPELEITVHESAPMPSARACATCFVVNGQAYIFGGRDSVSHYCNDLWRYTQATDSWEHLGATPLTPRVNATSCIADGKVYIGLGFNGGYYKNESYLRDWWEYQPQTDTWTRLADYPNSYTDDATSFTGDGELYVGYGFCYNYRRDFFRYTIATNQWDSIDVGASYMGFPTRSFGGTGCTCAGRHFMGTGYREHSLNWWAELVDRDHWEQRASVPGQARTLAASTATDNYIYLAAGMHYGGVNTTMAVLRDIRRYDPKENRWVYAAQIPEGLINLVAFTIGKRVYIGLGETEEWKPTNKIYWFEE